MVEDGILFKAKRGKIMSNKQLLREWIPLDIDRKELLEQADAGKPITYKACLQRKDAKNRNGRVYPGNLLMREYDRYASIIKENQATGELDHPESNVINLKNVSHIVREQWWKENDWMGQVEILPTPSGDILKGLVLSNVTIGVSSRGLGSTKQESDSQIVQPDFDLLCFDSVSTPSTHNAYIFKESFSIDNLYNNKNDSDQEILEALKEILGSDFVWTGE
jgi:hypothetical protein